MAKLAVSIFVAAVLCCATEGATPGDLFAGISSVGQELRVAGLRRLETETVRALAGRQLTAAEDGCVKGAVFAGLKELYAALGLAQNGLRAGAADWGLRLAALTQEGLGAELRQQLQSTLSPVLDRVIANINSCL